VFRDSVAALCDQAGALLDDRTPVEALRTWLRAQLAHASTYGSLAATTMLESLDATAAIGCRDDAALAGPVPAGSGPDNSGPDDVAPGSCEALRHAGALLLARAQDAGEVRDDVDIDDVLRLVGALALAADDSADAERTERLFTLVMDGLAR
jgi:hypothetical protein